MLSIVGALLVLIISAALQFSSSRTAVAPVTLTPQPPAAEASVPTAFDVQTVSVTPAAHPVQMSFVLAKGDSIASWDFQGAYTSNPELVAKAQAEISRLSNLLAAATSSKMILSVSIANEYELLGKGKEQYDYLGRAILSDATTGLPWHNLGVLMERLGAFKTAEIAYREATILQPQFATYQYAYLEFLLQNFKQDTTVVEKAFAAAEKNIGKAPYLFELRAKWEKS